MLTKTIISLSLLIFATYADGACPVLPPDTIGTCAQYCSSNADCAYNEECCSNGCGQECTVVRECPLVKCPECKDGFYIINNNGCPKCQCRKVPDSENVCKPGSAIENIFCGRGPGSQECPTGSSCKIAPDDSYALCCTKENLCKGLCNSKETCLVQANCTVQPCVITAECAIVCPIITQLCIYCPNGYKTDKYGCPTCECLP